MASTYAPSPSQWLLPSSAHSGAACTALGGARPRQPLRGAGGVCHGARRALPQVRPPEAWDRRAPPQVWPPEVWAQEGATTGAAPTASACVVAVRRCMTTAVLFSCNVALTHC
eukprot:364406-Chlamydomonas_euryale.AAC.3